MLRRRLDGPIVPGGHPVEVLLVRVPAIQNRHHLRAGDGLLLEEVSGDLVQHLPVFLQQGPGLVMALPEQIHHFPVRQGESLLGAVHAVPALQILTLDAAQGHHAELLIHAKPGHQIPGQLRGPLDVVGRAGGLGVKHQLLGAPARQQGPDLREDVVPAHEELLLLRQVERVAQRPLGVGHDGDLGHRLSVLLLRRRKGVAYLMIGDDLLLLLGDDGALLLRAGDDHLEGGQKVLLIDRMPPLAHRPQGRLVDSVGQVRAHAPGGSLGDLVQVHVLRHADLPGMDLEGRQPPRQIGPVHGDAPVEPPRTEQGLVQHLRPVGGRQDDDALGGIKAVHLRQELVEGLLPLVVAAAEAGISRFADGVDLIDEDDAGGYLGRLLEQVPDPAGAHAHEHLHES